jgi:hypothetical protein
MTVRNYIKNPHTPSENIWNGFASLQNPDTAPDMVQMTLAIENYIFQERLTGGIACARQFAEYDVPTRRTLRT